MAIITESRLEELIRPSKLETKSFSQVLNEAKTKSSQKTSIFLSHSHDKKEKNKVEKTVVALEKYGGSVYIDTNDESLPFFTDEGTVTVIKSKIGTYDKFVFLATNASIKSVWCNWELGYGDRCKYINNIAIFPLADDDGSWDGNEYLKVYPRIEGYNFFESFDVFFPDGSVKSLDRWLKDTP